MFAAHVPMITDGRDMHQGIGFGMSPQPPVVRSADNPIPDHETVVRLPAKANEDQSDSG
jgi:hypothetical protein